MFKRLQLLSVLSAWLLATGAQWDVIQVAGWSRMLASYSCDMPLVEAVKKTFGGKMCSVCKAVNEAKQQEGPASTPGGGSLSKIVLLFQPVSPFVYIKAGSGSWSLSDHEAMSELRSAPPAPPPRARVT